MKLVCEEGLCNGCGCCKEVCGKQAITIQDDITVMKALINEEKCISCDACKKVCPTQNIPKKTEPMGWLQGWSQNSDTRDSAASGGYATEIMKAFVKNKGIVYSCRFSNGIFGFDRASKLEDINYFIGSKYVKSNPEEVYKRIREDLSEKREVLFLGLPCQVAAVKNLFGENKLLYTADLICHGTPSANFLEIYLKQCKKKDLSNIDSIRFRINNKYQLVVDNEPLVVKGVSDAYSIAFIEGATFTENCYQCAYAGTKRISDLTLGDSWGSLLEIEERKRGISLAMYQNEKGYKLLQMAKIEMQEVNPELAIKANRQLNAPMVMPKQRDSILQGAKKGKKVEGLVRHSYPKQMLKQRIKKFLIKLKVVK